MSDLSWVSQKSSGILIPSAYKAGKLYGIVPDNQYTTGIPKNAFDFIFARSSIATRTNEAGLIETMPINVPRLQYPSCPSCLLEPARTNLALWSEDFTAPVWYKHEASVIGNYEVAPDGTLTADFIQENTSNSFHRVQQRSSNIPGTLQVASIFMRINGSRGMYFTGGGLTGGPEDVDQISIKRDGSLVSEPTGSNYSIKKLSNDWIKVSIWGTVVGTNNYIKTFPTKDNGDYTYQGDGVSGVGVWGAQFEEGTYPTTYIKTEAATSNRAVDAGSVSDLIVNGILSASTSTINEKRDGVSYTYRYSGGNKETFIDCISQGSVVEAVPTAWNLTVPSLTEKIIMFPESLTDSEICELTS